MCGVVGIEADLGGDHLLDLIRHRGPDGSGSVESEGWWLGHTRLAIIDPDARSDQPFTNGGVHLVFNGEVWNYRELREELRSAGFSFTTGSDTEVVSAALCAWQEGALERLEGMFALAWTDKRKPGRVMITRDRFGEIPLHFTTRRPFAFASEIQPLLKLGIGSNDIQWAKPGHLVEIGKGGMRESCWYSVPRGRHELLSVRDAGQKFRRLMEDSCRMRAMSDRPVCVLLSGGIDSAIVAYHMRGLVPGLVAYTAAMDPKSRDLRCARECAKALGIELREVPIQTPDADDLAGIVGVVEMPHKAQVEIGWACIALAKQISDDGFRVVFSGEGSDELWSSYGNGYFIEKQHGWYGARRKLFLTQHRKNFPRCNKIFMRHGVECRLPFLTTALVEYALSLEEMSVREGSRKKAILESGYRGDLPRSIVNRPKVAFQDGLGLKEAIAGVVSDPARFYRAEFKRLLA